LEGDLHASSLLGLQVDVPSLLSAVGGAYIRGYLRGFLVQSDANGL